MISTRTGISFATSAALIAIASAAPTAPAFAKHAGGAAVHCYGVNSCKGTSDCKTAHSDCKGMNACKGQGFKEMSAKACTAAGGSLTAK
ncbi:BufA2 family periplasmic bufferin-type metallophore [Sphingomonas sp. ASY06-1R]|jgi:hypothetical protein|uniref:BufA2 family periplasmic bufferin-type metallophore n=1 Tax=Sphingomonas sp. ASY06-1R TaxID=3445771 RepID=UPI003FA2C5C6